MQDRFNITRQNDFVEFNRKKSFTMRIICDLGNEVTALKVENKLWHSF